jgi:hypothetical protein
VVVVVVELMVVEVQQTKQGAMAVLVVVPVLLLMLLDLQVLRFLEKVMLEVTHTILGTLVEVLEVAAKSPQAQAVLLLLAVLVVTD